MGAAVTGGSSQALLEREQSCTGVWGHQRDGVCSEGGTVGTQEQDINFSGMRKRDQGAVPQLGMQVFVASHV